MGTELLTSEEVVTEVSPVDIKQLRAAVDDIVRGDPDAGSRFGRSRFLGLVASSLLGGLATATLKAKPAFAASAICAVGTNWPQCISSCCNFYGNCSGGCTNTGYTCPDGNGTCWYTCAHGGWWKCCDCWTNGEMSQNACYCVRWVRAAAC